MAKPLSFMALSLQVSLTCGPVCSTAVRLVGARGTVPTELACHRLDRHGREFCAVADRVLGDDPEAECLLGL